MLDSLWGEEFTLPDTKKKTERIVKKTSKPKELKVVLEKQIKSKKLPLVDRLNLITENVLKILGKQKNNVLVIKSKEELKAYVDKCIQNKIVAVDTETNNSLDPLTCKLMGGCIYTPGEKQAYIPVNHIDYKTRERLAWQITEADIKEQFSRFNDIEILMHMGKFDYEVLKCTCDLELNIDWDTVIAAKVLDENERSANLKQQYISKIDPEQELYDIEHLFENVEYAVVDPEIFALYAATDALMTYKLYEWQKKILELPESKNLMFLFKTVEMPVVKVTAEMELTGIELDKDYAQLLSKKYHDKLDKLNIKIQAELANYNSKIDAWKLTSEANEAKINNGKKSKSKNEQLENPINIESPLQLSILLYDILKITPPDRKLPRGTGEAILEKINLPICDLILKKRGILKLLNTFIDALPLRVNEKDGRIHAHFNQYGAQTGRFSSSDPNLQQIPSHNKEIRMIFKASEKLDTKELSNDNILVIKDTEEAMSNRGYIRAKELNVGEGINVDNEDGSTEVCLIKNIIKKGNNFLIQL